MATAASLRILIDKELLMLKIQLMDILEPHSILSTTFKIQILSQVGGSRIESPLSTIVWYSIVDTIHPVIVTNRVCRGHTIVDQTITSRS